MYKDNYIRLAFYKGINGSVIDWIIMLFTFGPYSHIDLILSNGSSITSIKRKGVIIRNVSVRLMELHPHYHIIKIPCPIDIQEQIEQDVNTNYLNLKYDYFGALFHFMPKSNCDKWYCSDIVSFLLHKYKLIATHLIDSNPNKLHNSIIEQFYKTNL